MVKQPCPNFRVITANFWVSELLVLRYTISITLSLVFELISVSYPNYVRLRVKCIEGVLGSNLDPYYNQKPCYNEPCYKEVQLYQDNISCVMRKPVYAICEQKRHRSASMHFTLNLTALCYMYICHIPLWIVKLHQSFLLSRPRKNICVFTIAWKNWIG